MVALLLSSSCAVVVLPSVYLFLSLVIFRILSVRELRTLLAMVSTLPLDLQTVHQFEALLRECDQNFNGTRPSVDPVEFETHYDPDLVRYDVMVWYPPQEVGGVTTPFSDPSSSFLQPLVTVEFTHACKPLVEKLNASFKAQPKYK